MKKLLEPDVKFYGIAFAVALSFAAFWNLGGCRHAWADCIQQRAVVKQKKANLIVTEFAVPVAVAVADYAPYFYEADPHYDDEYQDPPLSSRHNDGIDYERLADAIVRRSLQGAGGEMLHAAEKPTLFGKTCARCHTAEAAAKAADDRPAFGKLSELTPTQRLDAIDAVVNERMPKGGSLTPEQKGELIKELTALPDAPVERRLEVPPSPDQGGAY